MSTFSPAQIFKMEKPDSNLILRQYKTDLMARYMKIKSTNPKLKQDQIAKELCFSVSTLKRKK